MEPYNYRQFPQDLEVATFQAFRDAVGVGKPAPDGSLYDLASGESVTLSDLWRSGPLVIEFGSFS